MPALAALGEDLRDSRPLCAFLDSFRAGAPVVAGPSGARSQQAAGSRRKGGDQSCLCSASPLLAALSTQPCRDASSPHWVPAHAGQDYGWALEYL